MALKNADYKIKNYIKKINKNFLTPEVLAIILIIVALNADVKIMGICMAVFYTLVFLYELKIKKDKLEIDKNIIILISTTVFVYVLASAGICLDYANVQNYFLVYDHSWIYYIIVILMGYFSYYVIIISEVLAKPIKKLMSK